MNSNDNNTIMNCNQSINIVDRKSVLITGVNKVENFDNEEFLLITSLGILVIKGSDLELIKFDSASGTVSIKGYVTGFSYVDEEKKDKDSRGILNKLFR